MKAMVVTEFGDPNVLEMQNLPDPVPGDDDLLVEVHGAAVNPVDCKIRQTGLGMDRDLPFALGYDVAGIVRDKGKNVQHFNIGDEIYAAPALSRHGSNAEFVLVDNRTAAHKPAGIDLLHAALYPLVTVTAWEALFKHARLHRGETVLIHAGAGGVGHIAIQLAKDHGCNVITTASREESLALCRQLGADLVINYKKQDVIQEVNDFTENRGCHVVFETVGGDNFKTSIPLVAVHGRLVSILGTPQDAPASDLFLKSASLHFEFMGAASLFGVGQAAQGEILRTAADMIEAGKLEVYLHQSFDLKDLPKAHQLQETGHALGKIGIRVKK